MLKKFIVPFLFVITLSFGCSKHIDAILSARGELIDGGIPAADGAGYYIRLDSNEELKPENLPDSLQIPTIRARVEVSYQYTGRNYRLSCGSCPGMAVVHIVKIRRI